MYYFTEPMVEDDIRQVQEIERVSFTTPWSVNTYRRELRNPETCRYIVARASTVPPPPRHTTPPRRSGFFAALMAGFFTAASSHPAYPIVGYGGLWLTVDDAHITTIAVDPAHRGRKVGELLLNALIDQALDLQARQLTLEVRVSNDVAQNLYLKYGFQPGGKRPRYYTDNGEDALIMWTEEIHAPEYQVRLSELRRQLFAHLRIQAERLSLHRNDEPGPTSQLESAPNP